MAVRSSVNAGAGAGATRPAGPDERDVAPRPRPAAGVGGRVGGHERHQARPSRRPASLAVGDAGMATAEYAIATVAAAGFAGLLITILRSDEVRGLLLGIVRGALSV